MYCAPLGVVVVWEPSFLPHLVQYKYSIKLRSPQGIVIFFVWIKIKGLNRRAEMTQKNATNIPWTACCVLLITVDKIQAAARFVPDSVTGFGSFGFWGRVVGDWMGCLSPHEWQIACFSFLHTNFSFYLQFYKIHGRKTVMLIIIFILALWRTVC